MVRRLLMVYVVVLAAALLWSRVEAATVPARLPAGVTYGGGAYSVQGTAVGGAVAAASTVTVGTGTASIPVAYRLGELAGIAAKTAIRANAVALGAQVVLDYLLPYGIKKCETSGWCSGGTAEQAPNGKPYPASGFWTHGGSLPAATPEETCVLVAAYYTSAIPSLKYTFSSFVMQSGSTSAGQCWLTRTSTSTGADAGPVSYAISKQTGCLSGHTLTSGTCYPPGYVPAAPSRPASDADWAKVPTSLPDNVLTSVMQEGRGWLPATPQVSTQVQTVPLSATYKDPTTGVSYRDYAYVTPNPADPQTATLQVVKAQVDPATGNPVTDSNGNTPGSVKPEDPCAANPNRVGCMDRGDIPASPDLQATEKTISITPDSGWGADTMACPADIVVGMRSQGAQPAVFSFRPVCDGADMFRPIVIGLAWLAAVLIALGVGRRGD